MRKFLCHHLYKFQAIWPIDGNYFVKVCCAKCGKVSVKEELMRHKTEESRGSFIVFSTKGVFG